MSHQFTAPLDLLSVGESMIVLVSPDGTPLEAADSVQLHGGGAESNVAHYLAQIGCRSGWASRLGDDPFGRRLLSEFSSAGIDVSHVRMIKGEPTGVYFKDPSQQPSVFYYRNGSAASAMQLDDFTAALASTARLHVTGITAALNAESADLLRQLMIEARSRGISVSFDVNHRPPLWTREQASKTLNELATHADTVFVGRDEAESLWNTVSAEDVRALLPEVPVLVVKDGAIGATAFVGESSEFVATPEVEVVEPVGAGDAFAAGYLWSMIRDDSVRTRLRMGHLFAAEALTSHADYADLPPAEELIRLSGISNERWNDLTVSARAVSS